MRILFVRHGMTQWNIDKRLQGITDTELTEEGIQDARMIEQWMKSEDLVRIYSSPLQRTLSTAQIINESHHLEIEQQPLLMERDFKVCSGMMIADFERNRAENEKLIESRTSVLERSKNFLDMIEAQDDETVLAVTHGGFLNILFTEMGCFETPQRIKHRCIYDCTQSRDDLLINRIVDLNY